MTNHHQSEPEDPAGEDPGTERRRRAARRARLDRIFGEALPDVGTDEAGRNRSHERGGADEWLRRNVPPHHG